MPITRRTLLTTAAASMARPLPGAQRPNVLFLIADDLNTDVGCYGLPAVKTPHLDRLGARGVRFDRAYCQYPLCNPSRTSFLSGLRPETSRVFDQGTVLRKQDPKVEFLPDFFRRHGYFVAGAGKIFHQGNPNAAGFDVWEAAETSSDEEAAASKRRYAHAEGDRTPDWAVINGAEDSTADAIAVRKVTGWMEKSSSQGQPFFLTAGFRKPHLPWAVPKRYFDLYPKVDVPDEPPVHGIPAAALVTELGASRPPEPRWQAVAAYRAAVSYMDAQAGKILADLDRLKLRESTIIVMIGDNGFHLGDHHLWSKHTLFERATRVPMIMAGPGVRARKACARTTELLDIYPTLVELAGLPAPRHLQGASLVPLLRQPDAKWDRPARSVVQREGVFGRAIRTERWRYVEWNGGKEGSELYDHKEDEGEYKNLAGDPVHAGTVRSLRALLGRSDGSGKAGQGSIPEPG